MQAPVPSLASRVEALHQPTLHAQLARLPSAQVPVLDRQDGKGHGRRETSTLRRDASQACADTAPQAMATGWPPCSTSPSA